ncbi:MAG: hypothetical protein V4687_06815 [Bacteroidota bacterium]
MPYSIVEQLNNDFDVLLFDGHKLIHIATAGSILPAKLGQTQVNFDEQIRKVYRYRRVFEVIVNSDLIRNNFTDQKSYFESFTYMAKRGFYSYDKVDIDNIENQNYQLVARPTYNRKIELTNPEQEIYPEVRSRYSLKSNIIFIETSKEFPDTFNEFNITDFL